MTLILVISILLFNPAHSIWPPSVDVNLRQDETFEISENIDDDEFKDVYAEEEEMIKQGIILKDPPDSEKHFRIHQLAARRNKKSDFEIEERTAEDVVFEEFNPDKEEPKPWVAGYVDLNGDFIESEKRNLHLINDKLLSIKAKDIKRQSKDEEGGADYDYNQLKVEYDENIKKAESSNEIVNLTNAKEDESVKDSIKVITDFKKLPKNCTAEENNGIGLGAIECLWMDLKKPKLKNPKLHVLEKIARIIIIWILVYLIVAIPCWCQTGWCCCCFRCKMCRPDETIQETKQFVARNPIGVYHEKDGKMIKYTPTTYEKYAQKKLEEVIFKM